MLSASTALWADCGHKATWRRCSSTWNAGWPPARFALGQAVGARRTRALVRKRTASACRAWWNRCCGRIPPACRRRLKFQKKPAPTLYWASAEMLSKVASWIAGSAGRRANLPSQRLPVSAAQCAGHLRCPRKRPAPPPHLHVSQSAPVDAGGDSTMSCVKASTRATAPRTAGPTVAASTFDPNRP